MATDFAYTFHVRTEKRIAEYVFKRILEADMHYCEENQAGIKYFNDERGHGLFFYGVATDEPSSKLKDWLAEFSNCGVEIDWMMDSNDGWVYTACYSFIDGKEIVHLDEETYIEDWSDALHVGKAISGDKDALSKIPDLIHNFKGSSGDGEHVTAYLTMFCILSEAGKLNARSQDVEKWEELLSWMKEPDNCYMPEDCEALLAQIRSAIETRKLLDRAVTNAPKRHMATI